MKTYSIHLTHPSTHSIDQAVTQACEYVKKKQDATNNQIHSLEYLAWLFFLKCLEHQEQRAEPVKRKAEAPLALFKDTQYTWSAWIENVSKAETQEQVAYFLYQELFPLIQTSFEIDTKYMHIYPDFTVFKQLLAVVDSVDLVQNIEKDTTAYLYSKLLDILAKGSKTKSYKQTGIFSTPLPLVRFMVKLASPQQDEIIYDPACGAGNLLIAAHKYIHDIDPRQPVASVFQGSEVHPSVLQLCKMNLSLHNVDCSKIRERDITRPITISDLFTYPDLYEDDYQKTEKKKLVILTHPPFDVLDRQQIQEKTTRKGSSSKDYDNQFLEHCMDKLVDIGDKCVIVVSQNILLNRSTRDIEVREKLVNNFNLRMVVQLPPETFDPFTHYPTYLLFFQKSGRSDKILYCKMQQQKETSKKKRQIRDEEFDQLLTVWQKWIQSPTDDLLQKGQEMYIQIKDSNELRKPDFKYILTIDVAQQEENEARDLSKTLDQLLQNCADLHNLAMKLRDEIVGETQTHETGE
ncbi:restriction modification enzyme M subunit [Reticulibacter mediterranei]|uniref:site-specific DNA-methyltransferase (adenine-specific) n=1 Tax=Reticulibacter mediterranei TaxID=2778369 RepID=A0A8J3ILU6_9CHLR|nr:N-6 DNA methylase [Reticulibacter mediterranei]GHO96273.1 restriction modification enzyme M subunit [Reticulibacter mediterranei]